jgi:RpiB/LacA/LacB family sugar-phosphate isomerase
MRIAVACDHGGFSLKSMIIETIRAQGLEPIDLGTFSQDSEDDYPDFVEKAGLAIQNKQADRAIIVCGSGVGACIAANKMKGLYASICHDTYSAHQGVEHDDMNVLCMGARIIGVELAREIVIAFLQAVFSNGERHVRRVQKTRLLERKFFSQE